MIKLIKLGIAAGLLFSAPAMICTEWMSCKPLAKRDCALFMLGCRGNYQVSLKCMTSAVHV